MADEKQGTRTRIMDAAEELFAHRGFDGVSVRQIMSKVGADVSLAYYHFKSKRDLFEQVMLRRAEYLNDIRMSALESVLERYPDEPPPIEEIIAAFTQPLLELLAADHEEWKHYFQLVAQINNSTDWGGELMTRLFDPLVRRFVEALKRSLPDADDRDLYWSYYFLSGALTLTFAETGRIDNLSGGVCKASDMAAISDRMPRFLAAGFRELCSP